MAQKHTVTITDDIDGTEDATTVRFALDDTAYEIDLSDKNSAALRKALEPYVENARKLGANSRGGSRKSAPRSNKEDLAAIRAWANENGHTVSERGRIATSVVEAYRAAH